MPSAENIQHSYPVAQVLATEHYLQRSQFGIIICHHPGLPIADKMGISEQVTTGSGNFGAEARVFEIQSWTWSRAPVENSDLVVDLVWLQRST